MRPFILSSSSAFPGTLLLASVILGGCGSVEDNVTEAKYQQLTLEMSQQNVEEVIGSKGEPVVLEPKKANSKVKIYTWENSDHSAVTVVFDNDKARSISWREAPLNPATAEPQTSERTDHDSYPSTSHPGAPPLSESQLPSTEHSPPDSDPTLFTNWGDKAPFASQVRNWQRALTLRDQASKIYVEQSSRHR